VNGAMTLQASVIGPITTGDISGYSAKITWATDQASSSTVEYGTTTAVQLRMQY